MVTATHKWRRWSGPRSDLIRAVELASAELEKITTWATAIDLTVKTDDGLTETTPDMSALVNLHRHDLARVRSITIGREVDADEWSKVRDAHYQAHTSPPPRPTDKVSI